MQLSNSLTPKSVSSSGYLLRQYDGAAAAYSLQRLDTSTENVVRARRSTDDAEADFTAQEVSGGSLREFSLNNDADLIRFADQATAADKRMYFDGSNDEIRVAGMTSSADYFGACTIEATIFVEDPSATQVVWSLGSDCYRMVSISGQWRLNGTTDTSVSVTSGLITIAVDYDASGQATELRIGGATEWTGTAPAGTTPTTLFHIGSRASGLYFKGLIYDFSLSGSAVKNFAFNGYGNTNGDWEDQVGSNDGTVVGSPALFSGQGFDAFVTTLYDQSGNGRNALQSTASSQPQIVADGVVVTDSNGNAALDFDGSNSQLSFSESGIYRNLENAASFVVAQHDITSGERTLLYISAGTGANITRSFLGLVGGNTRLAGRRLDADSFASVDTAGPDTNVGLHTVIHGWGSGSSMRYRDGALEGTLNYAGSGSTSDTDAAAARIGYGAAGSERMDGYISEIIIYNSDQSANRAAIEQSIASRYGITLS